VVSPVDKTSCDIALEKNNAHWHYTVCDAPVHHNGTFLSLPSLKQIDIFFLLPTVLFSAKCEPIRGVMAEQRVLATVLLLLVLTGLVQPLIKWLLAALLQERDAA
jgi:hypothetical protein